MLIPSRSRTRRVVCGFSAPAAEQAWCCTTQEVRHGHR
jgi:hypothetical protein